MNKLFSALFGLLFIASGIIVPTASAQEGAPQWKYVSNFPDAPGGRYDDMVFLDTQRGWVVNLAGEIWHTPNGGDSWTMQHHEQGAPYRSVAFRDEDGPFGEVGWAGTVFNPASVLWETRDGGEHWIDISHRISGVAPAGICGIWSLGEFAWGVGAFHGDPTIIKTSNGGITWEGKAVTGVAGMLVDVYFQNEMDGFAVGGTDSVQSGVAVILRTRDGGETWEQAFTSTLSPGAGAEWGWKISFPSEMVGYVSVEYNSSGSPTAKLLKTEDGGETWREIQIHGSTSNAGLQGLGFISETTGWASGRGITSVTTDGGESWTQLPHYSPFSDRGQLDGRMNRFFMVNDTLAYGVGQRLYVLSGHNQIATDIEVPVIPESFTLETAFPNPFSESTTLRYSLREHSRVRVRIIDVLGRIHKQFPEQIHQPGAYELKWDGRDDAGTKVASGNYIMLIDIGNSMETKRVVFLK